MSIFKVDKDIKRMIFNVESEIADRIEALREEARTFGKKLDVDTAVNKGLEKFLKKAEKKFEEMRHEAKSKKRHHVADIALRPDGSPALPGEKSLVEKLSPEPAIPSPSQIMTRLKENPAIGDVLDGKKP